MRGGQIVPTLRWTGHALVDMGMASLMVFADHKEPRELTDPDLETFAQYAEKAYFSPELGSYLTVLFTSNFINPSFTPERKRQFVKEILRVFTSPPRPGLSPCAYCGRPSVRVAHRDLIPMLTGRESVNFFPGGVPGLALCGYCIVALQALTIGAPMCSGRALIVSCDDPALTLSLIRAWQPEIRKRIQLSEQTGEKLSPLTRPLTRTVEALSKIEIKTKREDPVPSSVTVYHLSNSGQGPQAAIYFLPSLAVRFIQRAQLARYAAAWKEIVRLGWELPPKTKKGGTKTAENAKSARNYLYEDLFELPDCASQFIRVYFLRKATAYSRAPGDPRSSYRGWKDYIPGLWELVNLFLREVVAMNSVRIEAIRKLGDVLAEEIATENDRRLWGRIYRSDAYWQARRMLIQASQRRLVRGLAPALSLDEFLDIFEEGEELARVDWRLAWDLVLIRVIEKLYEAKWFDRNRDALAEDEKQLAMEEA